MFSTAVQISERSLTRLVIVCPPYYWIGGIFIAVGLFVLIAGFSPGDPNVKAPNLKWLTVAVSSPFLLAGLGVATAQSRAVFDRSTHSLRTETRAFGFPIRSASIPLDQIQRAIVETNAQRGQALTVRLRNGELVRIAGASTQQGYGQAASAINDFLHRPD